VDTLRTVLFVIFIVDSILLVLTILIQSGRGGGLAGALGGISSADSALGVRAASQIEKITGVLAAIFLSVALALAFIPGTKRDTADIEKTDSPGGVSVTDAQPDETSDGED